MGIKMSEYNNLNKGVSLAEVNKVLGHAAPENTMNIYNQAAIIDKLTAANSRWNIEIENGTLHAFFECVEIKTDECGNLQIENANTTIDYYDVLDLTEDDDGSFTGELDGFIVEITPSIF